MDVDSNDSDVSSPASLSGVIAVGAHDKSGIHGQIAPRARNRPQTGEVRSFPNQKPEIIAPGVLLWSCSSNDSEPPYAYSTELATPQ